MNQENVKKLLQDFKKEDVERYIAYMAKLEKDEKNKFMQFMTDEKIAEWFRRVASEWLVFDWIHITLLSTWIFYDYVALKNKMLIVYPESVFDIWIVYEWDDFSFSKKDWKVFYNHKIANPFSKKESDIIGAYAIVKNKRWEFITLLSKEDLQKHRETAKTDFIWKSWYTEMCMKTVTKKACKMHFWDIYTNIEEMDNENYDANKVTQDEFGLTFQDYIDNIIMETDINHIELLLARGKNHPRITSSQEEWLESEATKRKNKLLSENWQNLLPNHFKNV